MLLKIVQGPNAGAEIALEDGVNVRMGRSEECDIVLADTTLADVACEIETVGDKVTLILPGGTQTQLEPFKVVFLGTTAVAAGPAETAWKPLVWPKQGGGAGAEASMAAAQPAKKDESRGSSGGLIWILSLVILLLVGWALYLQFGGNTGERVRNSRGSGAAEADAAGGESAAPGALDINRVAEKFGLALEEADGARVLRGNLKKRAERLEAAALAYQVSPGIKLDISDDESLKRAADDLLFMLTEGAMSVTAASNRCLAVAGAIDSPAGLKRVLDAMNQDVPWLDKVDCEGVRFTALLSDAPKAEAPAAAATAPAVSAAKSSAERVIAALSRKSGGGGAANTRYGEMCGVITKPIPCIILRNGMRIIEGAEIEGNVVEKISAEKIVLRAPDGTKAEWAP